MGAYSASDTLLRQQYENGKLHVVIILIFCCQDLWMIVCVTLKLCTTIHCGIESQSAM